MKVCQRAFLVLGYIRIATLAVSQGNRRPLVEAWANGLTLGLMRRQQLLKIRVPHSYQLQQYQTQDEARNLRIASATKEIQGPIKIGDPVSSCMVATGACHFANYVSGRCGRCQEASTNPQGSKTHLDPKHQAINPKPETALCALGY